MKKLTVILAFLLLAIPNLSFAQYKAFVLFGQSNMRGSGIIGEVPYELQVIPQNAELWVNGSRLNSFTDLANFGPELTLIHNLSVALPNDQLLFIKYAVNGTSLYAWSPTWTPTKAAYTENEAAGNLYPILLSHIQTATEGKEVSFSGFFMMQGERDAKYEIAASHYKNNMILLVSALRADLVTEAPFIYGIINPPPDRFPYAYQVIQAQMGFVRCLPKVYPVSTHGLTKQSDGVHYDTPGQQELGKRFADVFLRLPYIY